MLKAITKNVSSNKIIFHSMKNVKMGVNDRYNFTFHEYFADIITVLSKPIVTFLVWTEHLSRIQFFLDSCPTENLFFEMKMYKILNENFSEIQSSAHTDLPKNKKQKLWLVCQKRSGMFRWWLFTSLHSQERYKEFYSPLLLIEIETNFEYPSLKI